MASADEFKVLLAETGELQRTVGGTGPNPGTAAELLAKLQELNRASVGTMSFRWPDHPHPLHFRCGSSDLANFVQIFLNKEYDAPLPYEPVRIFDLGGYAGYAAAYLANKFPDASIVSVEPSIDSFRLNTLNTASFENVRRLNAGVSDTTGFLAVGQSFGGDWGSTFSTGSALSGGIPCYSLADLMQWANWDRFDFLKCDIEGAEREVFRQARDLIAANVHICAVEVHEGSTPGAESAVTDCFDIATFDRFKHGEFHYFVRRGATERPMNNRRLRVLKPSFGLRAIELIDVPTPPWGYYTFEGDSCQLHPGEVGANPAMLRTRVELSGHTYFESELSVWNPLGFPVQFSVCLSRANGPESILVQDVVVMAGERQHLRLETGALHGLFELTLSTRMAKGAPTNHQAVANWHHPSFC